MATFCTALGSASAIEQMLDGAREQVTLVSPWVQLSPTLAARLADVDRRQIPITLVIREPPERLEDRQALAGLEHARFLTHPTLHAKCFANERALLITSLNLFEYSISRNREMGVLLTRDDPAFEPAARELRSIVRDAHAVRFASAPPYSAHPVAHPRRDAPSAPGSFMVRGPTTPVRPARRPTAYCILCKAAVRFAPDRPYCRRCYDDGLTVEQQGGERPLGRHCHGCGDTSGAYNREHSLCPTCEQRRPTSR